MAEENKGGSTDSGAGDSKANDSGSPNDSSKGQSTNAGAASGASSGQESGRQQTFDAGYVKDLREEAKSYRVKANDFEAKFNQATQKVIELEARLTQRDLETAVAKEAGNLKIVDADAAFALLDHKAIEFDPDGVPKNIEDLLKKLVEAKPYLVQQQSGVSTNATNPARTGSKFTLEQIKGMSTAELNANWAEVEKVLAAG